MTSCSSSVFSSTATSLVGDEQGRDSSSVDDPSSFNEKDEVVMDNANHVVESRNRNTSPDLLLSNDILFLTTTTTLSNQESMSSEELVEKDGVQKAFNWNGDGLISRIDFKTSHLKLKLGCAAGNAASGQLPFGINHFSLVPALTPADTFVKELETFALQHRATNHPFLHSVAAASFGKEKTADYLLRFISAYSKVNTGFIPNVKRLVSLLDDPKHKAILEENLEEEMGIYDEETLREVETQFGVRREVIMDITHGELFQNLLSRLEQQMKVSYREAIVSDDVMKPYLDAMKDIGRDQVGLSASLYFGSEVIVPKFYSYILQGLQKSINISNEDAIFFILHIDMDADHADHMRQMIVDFSNTRENRLKLVMATDSILKARSFMYDKLVAAINL